MSQTASGDHNVIGFVNLRTGVRYLWEGTGGTRALATISKVVIGNGYSTQSMASPCGVAAAAVLNSFISLRQAALWLLDPWGFWYLPRTPSIVLSSLGTSAAAGTQAQAMILA